MRKTTSRLLRFAGAIAIASFAAISANAAILQEINGDKTPAFYYWGHPSGTMGYYWTPAEDMNLESIQTQLNTRGFNTNNNFILTTTLYSDRPAVGGTALGSYTFNGAGYGGGWTSGSFSSALHLTAGTQYFIGFSGWDQVLTGGGGGGVVFTDPADYPAGTTFEDLFPLYSGTAFDIQITAGPNPVNLDMPILRFVGTLPDPDPGTVPEPSSLILLSAGMAMFGVVRWRRAQS